MRVCVRSSTPKPSELVLLPPNLAPGCHLNSVHLDKLCTDEFLHHTGKHIEKVFERQLALLFQS